MRRVSLSRVDGIVGRWESFDRPEERSGARAAKAVLRMAMERELTPRQLECVKLYFFEGLTEKMVGERLGINRATVCRHLQKAKGRLRNAVEYGNAARRAEPED